MTQEDVLAIAANEYGIPASDITGRIKTRPIAEARQMAMYLLWKALKMSKSAVGRFFGRTHATASHDINRASDLMSVDKAVKKHHDRIVAEMRRLQEVKETTLREVTVKPQGIHTGLAGFKTGFRTIPQEQVVEWTYRLFPVMNLAWTYVETCIDIAAILRISELKGTSRLIRETKREYDRFRSTSISDDMAKTEAGIGEAFEERYRDDFNKLHYVIEVEVTKFGLNSEYHNLVVAVHQCLALMETAREYCRRCEAVMRRDYHLTPPPDSMIQNEFVRVIPLIRLYAGDCYEDMSQKLKAQVKNLTDRLEEFEIPEELMPDCGQNLTYSHD